MVESMSGSDAAPLPSISHQDIQEATQGLSLQFSSEHLQPGGIHQQAIGDAAATAYAIHYQLQGTWLSPSGRYLNYIALKENMESKLDISKIYFNLEDISKCDGFNLDLAGVTDRYHLNLLNIVLEFPQSEFVCDLFKNFLDNLNPLASTIVSEPMPINAQRLIESKVPKMRLKMENYNLEGLAETSSQHRLREPRSESADKAMLHEDEQNNILVWEHQALAPQVKLEEDKRMDDSLLPGGQHGPTDTLKLASELGLSNSKTDRSWKKPEGEELPGMFTTDERRFLNTCRTLGLVQSIKEHYSIVKSTDETKVPVIHAVCLHCQSRFISYLGEGDLKVEQECYRQVACQVVDHIIVKHFKTFAYNCDICSLTYNTKESFNLHMKDSHTDRLSQFQCNECHEGFVSKRELNNHVRLNHQNIESGPSLQCKTCNKSFSSKKTMYAHLRSIHGISNKAVKQDKQNFNQCKICGETKKNDYNLLEHVKKFHENPFPEPIPCQLCVEVKQLRKRKYHTPYAYDLHIRQIHSDGAEGKVVCEYCSKEFVGSVGKVKFALKVHIEAVHLGKRKKCEECGKTFISNIVLNKHKKFVHRKEGSFPCKACGKIFKYSQQAVDHEYKDRGLTPYECKFCSFKSADNWALAKHKKVCSNVSVDGGGNVGSAALPGAAVGESSAADIVLGLSRQQQHNAGTPSIAVSTAAIHHPQHQDLVMVSGLMEDSVPRDANTTLVHHAQHDLQAAAAAGQHEQQQYCILSKKESAF